MGEDQSPLWAVGLWRGGLAGEGRHRPPTVIEAHMEPVTERFQGGMAESGRMLETLDATLSVGPSWRPGEQLGGWRHFLSRGGGGSE